MDPGLTIPTTPVLPSDTAAVRAAASPTPLTVCVRAIHARRSGCSLPDRDHAAGLDGTDAGGEQHLHRRASKSRSASTESSGSIANTPDPRSFSQGRWLGEMPPAGGVSRATGLPWRVISTTSPPLSTWRIHSRPRALHQRPGGEDAPLGPAGGSEALARDAQCPGRRR